MRIITVKIETDSEESFDLIKDDIKQELSCCWNLFDKIEISDGDESGMDDLISRHAVRLIESDPDAYPQEWNDDYEKGFTDALNKVLALPSAQPTDASCWGCNCLKMERLKEQKTFSEMVHLHDAETHSCDIISRQAAIDWASKIPIHDLSDGRGFCRVIFADDFLKALKTIPFAQSHWTPCSERLPEDLEEVNVTWVNHEPEPYYDSFKDKPFTATAVYYKEKWYWYSSTCVDWLAEYGQNPNDEIDDGIEIIAWMPLPKPYGEREK